MPSAVPSATVETGMPSCLARCAAASGSLPSRALAVGEQDHRGRRALAVLAAARGEAVERRVERVAGRGAAVGLQASQRGLDLARGRASARRPRWSARRSRRSRPAACSGTRSRNALGGRARGLQPRRVDVGGRHRARLVGDEHDRRLLDRHGDRRLRLGGARPRAPPPRPASRAGGSTRRSRGWRRSTGEHRRGGEAHGEAAPPVAARPRRRAATSGSTSSASR